MKRIIDMPEEIENYVNNYIPIGTGYCFPDEIIKILKNGIPIPENATNGDVLKRLLYGKAIITEFIHDVNISVNNNVIGQFDMEWWNSPYKRGDTE